jgi:hypothetical protein
MTTVSTPETSSNRCEPLIIEQNQSGITCIKTIVHWWHSSNELAHTLARIYKISGELAPIVVLSEIRSNNTPLNHYRTSMGLDLGGVATALIQTLGREIDMPPEQIRWFDHYGTFSSYDSIGSDTFGQIGLFWNGKVFENSMQNHRRLSEQDVDTILGRLNLEEVYLVLRQLNWTAQ